MQWKYWRDTWRKSESVFNTQAPVEQLLLTKGKTDYLYYRHVLDSSYVTNQRNRTKVNLAQEGMYKISVGTHRGNALVRPL